MYSYQKRKQFTVSRGANLPAVKWANVMVLRRAFRRVRWSAVVWRAWPLPPKNQVLKMPPKGGTTSSGKQFCGIFCGAKFARFAWS